MATLNTLRTKFGIVLSAVIAVALLAFVFSLKSEMGFSGNDPIVMKMNNQGVSYTEYITKYELIKTMTGVDETDEVQINNLSDVTKQSFFTSKVMSPVLEKLGVTISEQERVAMIRGEIPTQAFYNAFADPATGAYSQDAVTMFLLQAGGNPEAEAAWSFINETARDERESMKYLALLGAGAFVNDLEVRKGLEFSNKRYAGRWSSKRYSTVADSLTTVSRADIKRYYNENIERYKKLPTRDISYVSFNTTPTDEDKAVIEQGARSAAEEFRAATDIREYIRNNRYGSITSNFVHPSRLIAEEATAFAAGELYGPVLRGNRWRISRPLESRMAPDSMGIRLIVLPYTSSTLADSLLLAIEGGASFAQAATDNSMHQSSRAGGEIGILPYSVFSIEMADALKDAKDGMVVKIEVGDMIQLLEVYNVGKKIMQYQVASIEYPVIASQPTINNVHNNASLFAIDAKGSKGSFEEVAKKHGLSSHSESIALPDREVIGLGSSREIVRWANEAKVGDISEIFKVDGGYVVATLTAIEDNKYSSLESVSEGITAELRKQQKFDIIKSGLSGTTFEQAVKSISGGTPRTFEDISFSSMYISGMGVEPRVIGSVVSTTQTGVTSEPVMGNNALYIFELTSISDVAEPLSLEAEKVRLQASAKSSLQHMALPTIQNMSNIEDFRSLYF